jgi:hypothetical protein
MTALIQDRKTDKLNLDNEVFPTILGYPVAASTSIYGGALVALNASGYAVPSSATAALKCIGRADRQALNQATGGSPGATGAAGSITVQVRQGVFYFNINADSTITIANVGANVYASDDNTVSLSDAGGTRPYAGFIVDPAGDMAPSPLSGQVGVFVGLSNPYAQNPELTQLATQYKARAVVTLLQSYTGSGTNILTETANGAWQVQDGITNVVGDVVFIPANTANLVGFFDSGPWVITSLGGAGSKWTLQRPDWFTTGGAVIQGLDLAIGGEGTAWAGNTWRSFAASGQIIGTNDPVFYPRFQAVTTAAMVAGVSAANSTLFVCARAQYSPIPVTPGGSQGILRMSTTTTGYPGTSSLVVTSSSNTDTSTVKIQVWNF